MGPSQRGDVYVVRSAQWVWQPGERGRAGYVEYSDM